MTRRSPSLVRSCSGTAAVEFAIIVPIMIAMFAGVVEIGRIYQVYNAVNRLATQYAIVWSDCSDRPVGACNTELSAFSSTNMISNLVPQLQSAGVSLSMFQVSVTGTSPSVVYAYPSGSTLSSAQTTAAQAVLTNGQSGVVVTVSYTHTLQFFPGLMNGSMGSLLSPTYTAVQLKG